MIISSVEDYLNLAKNYRDNKEFERAIALYEKAITIDAQLSSAYRELGEIYTETEQLDKAIHYYQFAHQLEPNSWLILQKIGNIFLKKADLITAAIYFQRSINLNLNYPWSHNNLGIVMEKLGVIEQAISCYEKVIKLNPDFIGGYHNLVKIQEELGNSSQLIKNHQKIIELTPNAWWFYQKLGVLLEKQDQLDRAIALYEKVIELNPQLTWAYHKLGKIYEKSGDKNQLINFYQIVINQQPESWATYEKLGKLLKEQGQLERAIALYEKVIKNQPELINAHYALVEIYEELENLPKAIDYWHNIFPIISKNTLPRNKISDYHCKLGKLYLKQGELTRAITYFLRGLKHHPQNIHTYRLIGDVLEQQGKLKEAKICYSFYLPANLLQAYCQLPKEYAILANSPEINCIETYPATQVKILKSLSIYHKKSRYFQERQMQSAPAFLALIDNGRFWADELNSAVFTAKNKLIQDISSGCAEIIACSEYLSEPLQIQGIVACLASRWGHGYFHWMFEVFGRFASLIQSNIWGKIDKFVINENSHDFYRECLNKLGINNDQIISAKDTPHLQANCLLVPSFPMSGDNKLRFPYWMCDFLRQVFLNDVKSYILSGDYPKRLYISRNLATRRKIINEDEVFNLLTQYGFERIFLETLSVQEQALYLNQAEVVVAPHGAGLSNLVFCQPGTKVLELFNPFYVVSCYWELSNICDLSHYYLLGEDLSNTKQKTIVNIGQVSQDILVNIKKLQKSLKLMRIS